MTKPKWSPASLLAVVYPLGMMPKAPGTWGSLSGFPLAWALQQLARLHPEWGPVLIAAGLFAFAGLALWSIARTEAEWGTHDDGRIVIDETLGQAIACVFLPLDLFHMLAGFALFRLFDIAKPGPVGWADQKLPGAWGTLLDDVIAGIMAGVLLALLSMLRAFAL